MNFTNFNLNTHILTGLKKHGYESPTPIQEKAIQPVLDGRDLLGLAQTGTGKTAAFVLPILQRLSEKPSAGSVQAIIIAPTRELAEQTYAYISTFSKSLNLTPCVIYGGVSRDMQIKKLKRGADIVVSCPGRLLDLANDGAIDLSGIKTLVLDEADQMLDQGFLPDIKRIIKMLPSQRQNLVFSATMPREIRSLVDQILANPVEVSVDHAKPITKISHTFYKTDKKSKNSLLSSILDEENVNSAIVFTRTKHKARSLAQRLQKQGYQATSIQGNLSQQKRQKALDGFKNGSYSILVATDIAARGIDVAGISHIINYDIPGTTEAYTHRTGRTGRANQSGEAVTFTTAEDFKMIKNLEKTLAEKLIFKESAKYDTKGPAPEEKHKHKKRSTRVDEKHSSTRGEEKRRKSRGKKSSQRNRMTAFDFGI